MRGKIRHFAPDKRTDFIDKFLDQVAGYDAVLHLEPKEVAESVMSRMTGKKLTCPDCEAVLHTVQVEQFRSKPFIINYELSELKPSGEDWSPQGGAFHCPMCDSLNVDSLFREFSFDIDEA